MVCVIVGLTTAGETFLCGGAMNGAGIGGILYSATIDFFLFTSSSGSATPTTFFLFNFSCSFIFTFVFTIGSAFLYPGGKIGALFFLPNIAARSITEPREIARKDGDLEFKNFCFFLFS
jgi:hypothetical protein